MYTSQVNTIDWLRRSLLFAGVAAFCLVFSLIYNVFSHEVHSPYMTYLFLWPLLLGVLPAVFFWRVAGGSIKKVSSRVPAEISAETGSGAITGAPAEAATEGLSGKATSAVSGVTPGELSWQCYCEGVATLTMASMIRGILEIAGTASIYQQYLMIAGLILTAAGIAFYAAGLLRRKAY